MAEEFAGRVVTQLCSFDRKSRGPKGRAQRYVKPALRNHLLPVLCAAAGVGAAEACNHADASERSRPMTKLTAHARSERVRGQIKRNL